MTRIIKQPEVRRQEILDASMKLFYEKGYNKTSISDIAKDLNISQGLCYRYFKSKEEIFNMALEYYANKSADIFRSLIFSNKSVKEKLNDFLTYKPEDEDMNDFYHKYYHDEKNTKMHQQLVLKISEKIAPMLEETFILANKTGELNIEDPKTLAYFCVYGEFGMSIIDTNNDSESLNKLIGYIKKLLGF